MDRFFIVRLYDSYTREWSDCTLPLSEESAKEWYNLYTDNGTNYTKYDDGAYYKISETFVKPSDVPEIVLSPRDEFIQEVANLKVKLSDIEDSKVLFTILNDLVKKAKEL